MDISTKFLRQVVLPKRAETAGTSERLQTKRISLPAIDDGTSTGWLPIFIRKAVWGMFNPFSVLNVWWRRDGVLIGLWPAHLLYFGWSVEEEWIIDIRLHYWWVAWLPLPTRAVATSMTWQSGYFNHKRHDTMWSLHFRLSTFWGPLRLNFLVPLLYLPHPMTDWFHIANHAELKRGGCRGVGGGLADILLRPLTSWGWYGTLIIRLFSCSVYFAWPVYPVRGSQWCRGRDAVVHTPLPWWLGPKLTVRSRRRNKQMRRHLTLYLWWQEI